MVLFLIMERESSCEVKNYVFMCYSRSAMISFSSTKSKVLIKALGPRVSLKIIIVLLVNGESVFPREMWACLLTLTSL